MPTYEIISGVRRAKALLEAGHATATVRCFTKGVLSPPFTVSLADLRSPHKSEIEASISAVERKRWHDILLVARANTATYPFRVPIQVEIGSRGKPIKDIDVV